jgi:hypothetical protein
LLRTTAAADLSPDEASAGQVLALVPDTAGLYRAWTRPTAEQAWRSIEERIFAAANLPAPRREDAPDIPAELNAGTEGDLETRIDEPPLTDDRTSRAFAALRQRLEAAGLTAMLETGATRVEAGQVFVLPEAAVVLLANAPWDAPAVRSALTEAVNGVWSGGGLGAGWLPAANGIQELDGLGRLALAIDGPRLILGTSPDLVAAILARRTQPAAEGAAYAAGWRHARELPDFERLSRLIDFPELRIATPREGAEGGGAGGREPMFYSENAVSLGRTLGRVDSATINVRDLGSMLREIVVYRWNP